MKIIIVEDELPTAEELKGIVESSNAENMVSAILTSVDDAVEWINSHQQPDLIFADIRLGDGLSFEIFRRVQITAPVIFCTAYDEYAIKAFEYNSIDYLLNH